MANDGEQYGHQAQHGRQTDEYGNPVRQIDEYGNPVHYSGTEDTTEAYDTGTGFEGAHGTGKHEQLRRSGSSSSSEDDGMGGRRKKKGITEKIKEKLPGGHKGQQAHATSTTTPGTTGGYGYGGEQPEGHEKKGMMEKIKEKLPGGGNH